MKCILSGSNARIFAKAVQSLAKFGSDLFIEADRNGFQLRSVNANKSAVGTFKFCYSFFDCFDITGGSSDDGNYCRLSMKACLGVFKSMRQVETCEIKIEPARSKFFVQMNCRFETVKHYIISIVDDENISADVPIDDLPNLICGTHKLFSEITSNFHSAEEEITLEAGINILKVKNYVEGSRVNDKFMRSQLKLASAEFEDYNIPEETSVTFCLKEFKAFLLFAEALYESVNIKFQEAGSPIIFQIKKSNFFEGTLIMSTLSPDDITLCENTARDLTESFLSKSIQKTAPKRKQTNKPTIKEPKRPNTVNNSQDKAEENDNHSEDIQFCTESLELLRDYESAAKNDELPRVPSNNHCISEVNSARRSESEVIVTFVETEENEAEKEHIPQSPGNTSIDRRGLRSIFSRCFEATYVPREPSPSSVLYVPDSDDEN